MADCRVRAGDCRVHTACSWLPHPARPALGRASGGCRAAGWGAVIISVAIPASSFLPSGSCRRWQVACRWEWSSVRWPGGCCCDAPEFFGVGLTRLMAVGLVAAVLAGGGPRPVPECSRGMSAWWQRCWVPSPPRCCVSWCSWRRYDFLHPRCSPSSGRCGAGYRRPMWAHREDRAAVDRQYRRHRASRGEHRPKAGAARSPGTGVSPRGHGSGTGFQRAWP